MPRKARKKPRMANLMGTWFQCGGKHLTQDPIFLGGEVYCERDGCDAKCVLVHSAHDDPNAVEERRRSWNSGINSPSIGSLIYQVEKENRERKRGAEVGARR